MTSTCTFGYYPVSIEVETERFAIETLPDHSGVVGDVVSDPYVHKSWIYAPRQKISQFGTGNVRLMPYSARIFSLPKTHRLTVHNLNDPGSLDFLIWVLSFFAGMRLTSTEAGFLDATPIKPGLLVDFILRRCTLADAGELGLEYLESVRHDPLARKRLAAAIHALFLAQYPRHLPFETFQYLYMSLDACYSLVAAKESPKPKVPHAKRIQWMCEKFALPIPAWALASAQGASSLSSIRNETFHEGLFFEEPIGFTIYGGSQRASNADNVTLQMQALVCRLLVCILGRPNTSYVRSAVDTRMNYSLDLHG